MKEAVTFFSEGTRIAGDLYLPDGASTSQPRPAVLVCGGYTGVKAVYAPDYAQALIEAGYVALTFDYKGWGESDGLPQRLDPYGRVADAQAAVTFLELRPEVDATRIGLIGLSYGGATGIWLAAHDERVKCLVAIVTLANGARWLRRVRTDEEFTALMERSQADRVHRTVTGESERVHPSEIMHMDAKSRELWAAARKDSTIEVAPLPLENIDATASFNPEWVVDRIAPRAVMVVTADNDRLCPPEETRQLYELACDPRKFMVIENCTHFEVYSGEPLRQIMAEAVPWLDTHLSSGL